MGHECTRILEFDAAHRLQNHAGKCQHLHGHRYKVEITCACHLDAVGMVIDFGVVKKLVGGWIDENLDHNTIYEKSDAMMQHLHDQQRGMCEELRIPHKPWHSMNSAPTCENLAKYLFDQARRLLEGAGGPNAWLVVSRVRLWETPNCYADWCGS